MSQYAEKSLPEQPPPYHDVKASVRPSAHVPLPQSAQHQPRASSQPQTRTLHIYHEGLIHRKVYVLDSDKTTPLYNVEQNSGSVFSSKPHMTFHSANGPVIGGVSFPSFSRSIDMTIHGKDVQLGSCGLFTIAHQFVSPRGTILQWKRDGVFSGNMVCVDKAADPQAQLVARFEWNHLAISKSGTMEVSSAVQGVFLDEVVISGLGMYEMQRRRSGSSSGGNGG